MDFELRPVSEAGGTFDAMCEQHPPDFALRSAHHDRDGSLPEENIAAMVEAG
jgi:hypothetical protein